MAKSAGLSVAEKSWIMYDVANSAYGVIIMTAIMPIYYKSYIAKGVPEATSTAQWGLALFWAGLIAAVTAPVLGSIADTCRNKKLFLGIYATCGVLLTASFSLTGPGMQMMTLMLFAASLIAFNGGNVFYDSLLTDVTTKSRMDWVSGSGYAWGYIGGGIPFVVSIILIAVGGHYDCQVTMLKASFLITAVWWAVFSIPVLRNTRQKYYAAGGTVKDAMKNLCGTVARISRYRHLVIFLGAYFLYIDGVDTIITMAVPYGQDIGLSSTTLMLTVLGLQFTAFPFALLYSRMAEKYSARRMIFLGIGVYIVVTFLGFMLPAISSHGVKMAVFFLIAFLIATSQGGIQALSRSFYGKLIPKEQSAEFFGFYNIFTKFASVFGPLMIAGSATYLGHSRYGMLGLVFLFLAGGMLLACVKPPREEP